MNNNFQPNQNNQAQGQEREKYRLDVDKIDFDGLFKTKRTTTIKLAKTVSTMFRKALSDFEGCMILPNSQGKMMLTLYFADHGAAQNGSIKVLKDLYRVPKGASMADKIARMNTINRMKTYELTEPAKDILEEFIDVPRGKKIRWDNYTFEQTEGINYNGRYNILVGVSGLNINKILKKLYKKDAENPKDRIEYDLVTLRPDKDRGLNMNNYIIDIVQLNATKTNQVAEEIGIVPHMGGVMMIK